MKPTKSSTLYAGTDLAPKGHRLYSIKKRKRQNNNWYRRVVKQAAK